MSGCYGALRQVSSATSAENSDVREPSRITSFTESHGPADDENLLRAAVSLKPPALSLFSS
jgi:hypothetical protein